VKDSAGNGVNLKSAPTSKSFSFLNHIEDRFTAFRTDSLSEAGIKNVFQTGVVVWKVILKLINSIFYNLRLSPFSLVTKG